MSKQSREASKELYAEFLTERIYGSITLFAVSLGLLLGSQHITIGHAFAVIVFTTSGLWAASLFAYTTSYRVMYGRSMPKSQLVKSLAAHRGILVSAVAPVLLLGVAFTGLIEVRTALVAQIVLFLVSMALIIVRASRATRQSAWDGLFSIFIQIAAAAIIIGLKLASH